MKYDNENIFWFVLFAGHGKVSKISPYFKNAGIEYFYPLHYKEKRIIDCEHLTKRTLQPLLNNYLFVKSSKQYLDLLLEEIKLRLGISSGLYYRDSRSKDIIVVPDKEMQNFISVASVIEERIIYMSSKEVNLKQGIRVRITGGLFEGVEGIFMRLKGDRRVVVCLPDLLSVATTFVPLQYITPLE
jgi:transcription antitermination factor NusG